MQTQLELEIDKNFDFIQRNMAAYLPSQEGRYALLRDCCVIEFYDTAASAERAGNQKYGDQPFSIQEITQSTVDLGFFSYAFAEG